MAHYGDLGKLYAQFQDEIWQALVEDAETLGLSNPLTMLNETLAKETLDVIRSAEQFQNHLFWYLVERTIKKMVP